MYTYDVRICVVYRWVGSVPVERKKKKIQDTLYIGNIIIPTCKHLQMNESRRVRRVMRLINDEKIN